MNDDEAIECCKANFCATYGMSRDELDPLWRPAEWIIQAVINAYFYGRQG